MGYTGQKPTAVPLTSADIADGTITNDDLAGSISNDKLAGSITDAKISALSASKLTGALPAIDGGSLTGLAGGATKEFFVPFVYSTDNTSVPPYNSDASNFVVAYIDTSSRWVNANFYLPADYSSTTAFDIVTICKEAVTTNFDVAVSFGVNDEAHSLNSDSVTGLGKATVTNDIEVYNALNALNTGLAAGDYVGVKCTLRSSVAHRFLGCRVKYS